MSIALLFMLAAAAPQDAPTPPPWRDYTRPCTCEEVDPKADYVTFKGVVIDGEVHLDESGLKASPRQAVIFELIGRPRDGLSTPVKVWYSAAPEACVQFDYGKVYTVRAKRAGKLLETNACLLRDAEKEAQQ